VRRCFYSAPRTLRRERDFQRGVPLTEIFPVHSLGVITGQDARVLAFHREDLEERLVSAGEGLSCRCVTRFLYRPFDLRHALYERTLLERPRRAVMSHLRQGRNIALLALRQSATGGGALVTRSITGHKVLSTYAPNTVFPLFLSAAPGGPRRDAPNLDRTVYDRFAALVEELPAPEDVLGYVYAVLHAPGYLSRFREELRCKFPRIPLPRNGQEFARLSCLGRDLIHLHLLEDSRLLASPVQLAGETRFPLRRIHRQSLAYEESTGRLRLDRGDFYFEGLAPEVWRYEVGSYQVLQRWLRSRAGQFLTLPAIREFRWIAEALRLSRQVCGEIGDAWAEMHDE
jgi:hypothetical protein